TKLIENIRYERKGEHTDQAWCSSEALLGRHDGLGNELSFIYFRWPLCYYQLTCQFWPIKQLP
ncbi:hypothetical protein J6590_011389, partial [Homalodisca vitripennis]